jgi:hypothetical protein
MVSEKIFFLEIYQPETRIAYDRLVLELIEMK